MPDPTPSQRQSLTRWRLVLGKAAEQHGISIDGADEQAARVEALVGFLFGDAPPNGAVGKRPKSGDRTGGLGPGHAMNVPRWVDEVGQLFPREAKEVMERELVNRRGLRELMEKPEILERIEPNQELVKTLLTHRDLMNEKTRALARKIIDEVVQDLRKKLKVQVEPALTGAIRRDKHSPRRVYRNLDLNRTIRRNLHNYDAKTERLLVDRLYFHAAERRSRPWHVIVAVDQSGSMLDSAIFSAVMASIFAELPAVRTSLFLFDTEVADLSDQVGQPVDVLLSLQLGGGTDITQALQYANQLVRQPGRTIVVLITDFYEGRPERDLVGQVRDMAQAGVRMIGLGALGYEARPEYNKSTAAKCRKVGMDILSCTPEKLAEAMAHIIRG
ncbi:MAG: Mg-chelatase subunit ChlD [uncultured Phycisphaerae bacterium]|uniref:Mg-chelatase subunit ChlD n=1 Tax=uncultured Phycisphaerae bacterium TaxID=904963 RepID=A0A6J4Q6W6_9BACT|nr:MAG: Mg-chelatase subunit ChlD [uncultured Phycisphaerae bacterium]